MLVKQVVHSTECDFSAAAGLVAELKDLLFESFDDPVVAHALANLGASCGTEADPVLDRIPDCIQVMVAREPAAVDVLGTGFP